VFFERFGRVAAVPAGVALAVFGLAVRAPVVLRRALLAPSAMGRRIGDWCLGRSRLGDLARRFLARL
ncbi:hypothetical protein, partial [Mesorhizobium sp. M1E.F.Ca.ET.041.01.1.1]|uniref:hypothetical protein n=1 Tax=Mesorhizobium sp. M1E.F.Ca.ET.041.01.1.1 TaxID=2496759 RepID=UPI001AECDB5E